MCIAKELPNRRNNKPTNFKECDEEVLAQKPENEMMTAVEIDKVDSGGREIR